ncbi:acyltransferase family protein [Hyalangium versicolor]|uniref:acyltransferase family protein n=1 Tax=Hyalangium versicolor TaxID=2861190 RepID=UPI001CCA082D|nr:acyltransferase [Hyalangium versicolor]
MQNRREDSQTLSSELFCMRGIGILLVVLVHVLGVDAQHGIRKLFPPNRMDLRLLVEVIHSFNMAVMLMGSGVAAAAFGRESPPLLDFIRKKLNKLFVPMLVWAPVLFLMQELTWGLPHGFEAWTKLLLRMPTTWFPPYSIFWFVHALVGCTLLTWAFRKVAGEALGRWLWPAYFGITMVMHLVASPWTEGGTGVLNEYVELILYWNRFFALGIVVFPWLASVRQWLTGSSIPMQALVPAGFMAAIIAVYAVLPAERYALVAAINGTLGFCMLFSLSAFLRNRSVEWGTAWKGAWRRLVYTGSISMILFLFHLYFVSGMRIALERVHPETMVGVHLVLGTLAGCVGPWLLYLLFKGQSWFHWSVGMSKPAPRSATPADQSREGLASSP